MKILMINVVCGIRSTGRICTDLATALEAQGHEVKIAYGREDVPEKYQKYAVRIGTDLDVKLHGAKARVLDGCGFGSKNATEKFINWVRKYDPDVIHLHNIHGYYINIGVLFNYLRTCGKKIIWTLHDCWAFTGHSAYCDAVNCERWITGCHDCPNTREYPSSLVDRSQENWHRKKVIMDKISDLTIVTPSEWLAGLVRKSFLAQYPVEVIHNGIDTSQFYPMENDTREFYGIGDKFMILGVSTSWDDMKGFSDYLMLADMIGDNYQIMMVGLTKEQKEKLPKNIIGIERTNSVKELAQLYSAADVFLNLSYCENYPTVNLEARACGTNVITYRTGGSPESAGESAIIVDKGDLKTVAKAITEFHRKKASNKPLVDNIQTAEKYKRIYRGGYWTFKKSLDLIGKKVLIGVAAVWDKRKGLEDILELSQKTQNQIIVVGVSNSQLKSMPSNIIAYERTNDVEELRKLYAVADGFINPTYEDNFPTTIIEALCCGTSAISYITGGCAESIGDCGYLLEQGDLLELDRPLDNTIYFSKKCEERGNFFCKENMTSRYSDLYKTI